MGDFCCLTTLELNKCTMDTSALINIIWALRYNHSLERLVMDLPDLDCEIATPDQSWEEVKGVLMSSLEMNQSLTYINISAIHPERDLDGFIAFCCLRNKFRRLVHDSPRSLLPYVLSSLLKRPSGHAILVSILKDGMLKRVEEDLYDSWSNRVRPRKRRNNDGTQEFQKIRKGYCESPSTVMRGNEDAVAFNGSSIAVKDGIISMFG